MVTRNVRQISRYLPYSDGQLSLTPPRKLSVGFERT